MPRTHLSSESCQCVSVQGKSNCQVVKVFLHLLLGKLKTFSVFTKMHCDEEDYTGIGTKLSHFDAAWC